MPNGDHYEDARTPAELVAAQEAELEEYREQCWRMKDVIKELQKDVLALKRALEIIGGDKELLNVELSESSEAKEIVIGENRKLFIG